MKTAISILLITCILFAGCSTTSITNPRLDLAKFRIPGVQQEKEVHLAKAKEFIRHTKNSQIERMLGITSRYTIDNSGKEKIYGSYSQEVIPAFKNSSIDWSIGGKVEISEVSETLYLVGWTFEARAKGTEEFNFYISVFEEDGKYMVSQISRKK